MLRCVKVAWVAAVGAFGSFDPAAECIYPVEPLAHVSDIDSCIYQLNHARAEYVKHGVPLAVTVSGMWQLGSDGKYVRPFSSVSKYPSGDLKVMDANDLAANVVYLAATLATKQGGNVFPLGEPVGFGPYDEGTIKHNQWAAHLAQGQAAVDGHTWTTWNSFKTDASIDSGGIELAKFEQQHRQEYISMYVEGRGGDTGDRFLMHCTFAETDTFGPTAP